MRKVKSFCYNREFWRTVKVEAKNWRADSVAPTQKKQFPGQIPISLLEPYLKRTAWSVNTFTLDLISNFGAKPHGVRRTNQTRHLNFLGKSNHSGQRHLATRTGNVAARNGYDSFHRETFWSNITRTS